MLVLLAPRGLDLPLTWFLLPAAGEGGVPGVRLPTGKRESPAKWLARLFERSEIQLKRGSSSFSRHYPNERVHRPKTSSEGVSDATSEPRWPEKSRTFTGGPTASRALGPLADQLDHVIETAVDRVAADVEDEPDPFEREGD